MPKHSGKWVSYLRVSTDRQGKSGLGLEAQRQAVLDFLNGGKSELVAEYVEVESGRRNDRPQLAAALAACRKLKARLIVAKLDRLSRNHAFLAKILDDDVLDVKFADMPEANKLTLRIMAAVAQHEREAISARTKAALQAAKARGKTLGNPKLAKVRLAGHEANRREADRFAANVKPVIEQIRASGAMSLRAVAAALTARGVPTARGGAWDASTVANVMRRGA
jgi:DNA invertase Pin-like site-specific DNA recombinase